LSSVHFLRLLEENPLIRSKIDEDVLTRTAS